MIHVAWQFYLLISALYVFITVDVNKLQQNNAENIPITTRCIIQSDTISIKTSSENIIKPNVEIKNKSKAPKQNTQPKKTIKIQTTNKNINYNILIDSILKQRDSLLVYYQKSENKNLALDSISQYFLEIFTKKLIPFWYGTIWSMSGTTQTPKQGYISCGYFVSNTLNDMGLKFDRIKIAQMASRNIARTFNLSENVKMLMGCSTQEVVIYLKQNYKEGLYIVGLDSHSAFLLYYQNEVYLLHSGRSTSGVVIEYAEYSNSFISNRYYIGEVTTNKNLMLKWVKNETIPKIEIFEFGKK